MTWFTVVTADVIGSRKGAPIDRALKERLRSLTDAALLTPFDVSRGDEVQALCSGLLESPQLVRRLRHACRPHRLRIALGLGAVDEGLGSASSWAMNGPAFHLARAAMDQMREERQPATRVLSGHALYDEIANTLFAMVDAFVARWTAAQWEAIHTYEALGTYKAAAAALGVAPQNVAKRCRAAHWPVVRKAEETLRRLSSLLIANHP